MAKLIELRDVYKIYGEGLESEVRALDGVSLDIEKGEFVAVRSAWFVNGRFGFSNHWSGE